MPIVETQSLAKSYGSLAALKPSDFTIEPGEICGLLGPNGAGKSTLLRLLLGYLRPTSGSATIFGYDCYQRSAEIHQLVSYLPGDARMFGSLSGEATLRFFADLRGGAFLAKAQKLAERMSLDLSRRAAKMSTGMRQKLGLVVTLAADTPLVILDEPTSNLDPSARSEVLKLVRETRAAGRTILFSSHVLDEVEKTCDHVVMLRRGEIVHRQELSQLRQHRIVAQLTGELPAVPDSLSSEVTVTRQADQITIITRDELSPLLGWLATLPLADVLIEPLGLNAVYERFHSNEDSASIT